MEKTVNSVWLDKAMKVDDKMCAKLMVINSMKFQISVCEHIGAKMKLSNILSKMTLQKNKE